MKAGTQVQAKPVPTYEARQPSHPARHSHFHSCHQIGGGNLLQLADAFYAGKTSIASTRMHNNRPIFMLNAEEECLKTAEGCAIDAPRQGVECYNTRQKC
jgi:hypothetical protein